jgi:hypothetical protein
MRRSIVLTILLLLAGLLLPPAGSAVAAELKVSRYSAPAAAGPRPPIWRYNSRNQALPFPRSARAQAIWDSGACWSQCGAYCAWALNSCLYQDTQGRCLAFADACDRYCQRTCRAQAGPLLPFD